MKSRKSQSGILLLLIVLAMLAIGATALLVGLAGNNAGVERQQKLANASNDTLSAAKAALIGWMLQRTDGGTGTRLGNLPTPDSLAYGGYSGQSDSLASPKCLSNTGTGLPGVSLTASGNANLRCVGKFPWRDLSLDLGRVDTHDPTGIVPWLAVSVNLNFQDQCVNVLNSDLLNWTYPGAFTTCPAAANSLPYPWLTVRDVNGNVVSNRVAAVLLMPGPPIATGNRIQARSPVSPGNPADYLDAISVPLGCVSSCTATYDNADLGNQFIMIPPGTRYPVNAEDPSKAGQPLNFNDVLIYITIDELMPYLEKRVLAEMSAATKDSKLKTTTYPWAANFVSPVDYSAFKSAPGEALGLFPFMSSSAPAYLTDFNWRISGVSALAKSCVQVQSGPIRYVDSRQQLRTDFYSGTINQGAATAATCNWMGIPASGTAQLLCDYSSSAGSPFNRSFTYYSNSSCTTVAAGSPVSFSVSRNVSIPNMTPSCSAANFASTYQPADATHPQTYSWTCSSVSSGTVFTVTATDNISSPIPAVGTFSVNGVGKNVTVSNLLYQPIMPAWFYNNEWYRSAFYAVAPAKAPAPVTPCGATMQLTAGTNANVDSIVLLAGARLAGAPLNQGARPSASLSDYLETPNDSAGTTCAVSAPGTAVTNSFNDQVVVVAP